VRLCRFSKASRSDGEDDGGVSAPDKPVTREVTEWIPDRVLCRRFNVPDPYAGRVVPPPVNAASVSAVIAGKSGKLSDPTTDLFALPSFAGLAQVAPPGVSAGSKVNEKAPDTARKAEVEAAPTRPPVDLFKSIFEPSDSEDDE
jgi:G patch domain-containing protein 1